MQAIKLKGITDFSDLQTEAAVDFLYQQMISHLAVVEKDLVPDLSHISHFASYAGGMTVDAVEHVRENRFRLCYSVPWEMNWSCAGQTQSGTAKEKIHFTVSTDGELTFLLLRTSL